MRIAYLKEDNVYKKERERERSVYVKKEAVYLIERGRCERKIGMCKRKCDRRPCM